MLQLTWIFIQVSSKPEIIMWPCWKILWNHRLTFFLFNYQLSHFCHILSHILLLHSLLQCPSWSKRSPESPISSLWVILFLGHFIFADHPGLSFSEYCLLSQQWLFYGLCLALAYKRCHKRYQSRSYFLPSVHTTLKSRSFLVVWRFFSLYAHLSPWSASR